MRECRDSGTNPAGISGGVQPQMRAVSDTPSDAAMRALDDTPTGRFYPRRIAPTTSGNRMRSLRSEQHPLLGRIAVALCEDALDIESNRYAADIFAFITTAGQGQQFPLVTGAMRLR